VLKIRLRRMGSKQDAFYRVVVSDSRWTPQGPFVEVLGTVDPRRDPIAVQLDRPRTEEWIRKGARPSNTVRSLLAQVKRSSA
jgi:small subunit ribosomal protein S16